MNIKSNITMLKIKLITKFNEEKNEFLTKSILHLQNIIAQINRTGITSTKYKYVYRPSTKEYISKFIDYDYQDFTKDVSQAMDFENILFSKFILWRLNLGVADSDQFYFSNMIKLSGGNFGMMTNVSTGEPIDKSAGMTLEKIDNMNMDDIK